MGLDKRGVVLAHVEVGTAGADPLAILCGSGEQNVGGRVQSGFAGVLDNADDEADGDNLNGDVVGDAEQRAGKRDQQERAAGNTGSASCADGCKH